MGAMNVAVAILAVRMILLVAVCVAGFLNYEAAVMESPYRLASVGAFNVLVVIPLVWLSSRR